MKKMPKKKTCRKLKPKSLLVLQPVPKFKTVIRSNEDGTSSVQMRNIEAFPDHFGIAQSKKLAFIVGGIINRSTFGK